MTRTIVNAPNPGVDGNPAVTTLSGGRAVFAYQSRPAEGDVFDIVLRLREADGTLGPEYRPAGDWTRARNAEVATLSDGTLLLTWLGRTESDPGPKSNVLGQLLSESGVPLSPVIALDSRLVREARQFEDYRVEVDPEGGFGVAALTESGNVKWTEFEANDVLVPGGNDRGTYDLRYDGANLPAIYYGAEYDIDLSLGWDRQTTRLENGRGIETVLFEYDRPPSPSYSPLHVSLLGDDTPISIVEDVRVSGIDGYDLGMLPDGGFVVTWSIDGVVRAQLFDGAGGHRGDNFVVARTEAVAPSPSVAAVSNDEILFTWQDRVEGDTEVMARTVPVPTLAEGAFSLIERPYLRAYGEIIGNPAEGSTLRLQGRVDTNRPIESVDLQWFRSDAHREGAEAIEGATGLRFVTGPEEVDKYIFVRAAVEAGENQSIVVEEWFETSRFRRGTIENVPDPAEGTIPIAGTPWEGRVLRALPEITDTDGIPEGAFTYQWYRDGAVIEGAFTPDYRVTAEDVGSDIFVEVSFFDAYGDLERIASDPVRGITGPTEGDDILVAGAGGGRIAGLGGDDRIDGGRGDDTLRGDAGDDVFVFARGRGADVIVDFTPGSDRVEFDFDGIGGVRQLIRTAEIRQVGEDVLIDFGEGDSLTLWGVAQSDLTPRDALFV
ncbi:hypothetical protein [Jannaschia seohaensis]|uniref:Stomatal closure-related actin-binding protein Ig domain-containing protein n=1 Tax=Jannaschia seohaensis TaxID=475081 RepID=A0A2Y9A2B1_9RHOB|nr:hypothetical protein [Jannaschia seohaensis]PWJ22266.1 hypothetical protein BCF38_101677 [Jannaschia seohaensis]SSA38544.1 hypothetical protein SAMN05421539_101677 [Jannaschia seohaensis]